ncbi:ATP-dependent DNA helicase Pif1-like [Rhizophagus clarus]|uniref:ATP-dependent DNA helicase Pif1-like n=1 Tax=Rhizophagus clarus TaxID=94130 RepID=A0A8H3KSU1_9GLOM|nr:ATP-dependent DNA helicase Pif1-like [Rhizophagus clarus]
MNKLMHKICPACNECFPSINLILGMCRPCYSDKNEVKKFSATNNMDLGDVPEELKGFIEIEEILILQTFLIISVYYLHEGQYTYNIIIDDDVLRTLPDDSSIDKYLFQIYDAENRLQFVNDEICDTDCLDGETDDMIIQNFIPAPIPSHNENCIIDDALTRMQSESGSVMWPNIGGTAINKFNTLGYIAQAFPTLYPTDALVCITRRQSLRQVKSRRAADLYWPNLHKLMPDGENSMDEESDMKRSKHQHQDLIDNPHIAAWFFEKQFKVFIETGLIPKWGLENYWYSMKNNKDKMSRILTHFDLLDYIELVNKLQKHTRCSPSYCLRSKDDEQYCRFGFPKDKVEHSFIYENNRWRANVDLKPIPTICATLYDPYDPSLRSFQHLLLYTVAECDFFAQKTCYLLLRLSLYHSSCQFIILNLNKESSRWLCGTGTENAMATSDVRRTEQSPLQKYWDRPAELENLFFFQLYLRYKIYKGKWKVCGHENVQKAKECSEDICSDWMILAEMGLNVIVDSSSDLGSRDIDRNNDWFCGVRHHYPNIDSIDVNTFVQQSRKIEIHYNAIIANLNQIDPLRVIIMGTARTDLHLCATFPKYRNQPLGGQSVILIGNFGQLSPMIDELMYAKKLKRDLLSNDDAIHITPRKVDIYEINISKLRLLNAPIARIQAVHTGGNEASKADSGLVNGSVGTVDDILFQENQGLPSLLIAVLVDFDNYTGPAIISTNGKKVVPIIPI